MSGVDSLYRPGNEVLPERDVLRDDLISLIRDRNDNTPRQLQKELGPSQVSHPCLRKMAFGIMEVPRCNPQYDPLPSIVGTATHAWLEQAAVHANEKLGRQRWLTETRVTVSPGLTGSCDLYDHDTATVIDWKILGDSSFKRNRAHMSPAYALQVQFYGLGFENMKLPVRQVAVAILPRGGTLTRMHLWRTDYSRDTAMRGLAKRDAVIAMLNDFEIEINPSRYKWFPIEPHDCLFCPWWKPEPTSPIQCSGSE